MDMVEIIYNIKQKAISLLLVLLSCSCTGIHPASSSSTGTPVTEVDTSTFAVTQAIEDKQLFEFTPGTSDADINATVAQPRKLNMLCIQFTSGSKEVQILTSREIDRDILKELLGDEDTARLESDVLSSCSCTGIHPASSSSTGWPLVKLDTSTFAVRKAIGGEELFKFTPGTSYADINSTVAQIRGVNPLFIQLISGSKAVENAGRNEEPTGHLSYNVLTSREIDQDILKKLLGDEDTARLENYLHDSNIDLEHIITIRALNTHQYGGIELTRVDADDLKHNRKKQLKLLKAFLEIANPHYKSTDHTNQSLLEMFERNEPLIQEAVEQDIDMLESIEFESAVGDVYVGHEAHFKDDVNDRYGLGGRYDFDVVFRHVIEKELYTHICIKTIGNVTKIIYNAGADETVERDYPMAYLKELDDVLIITVLPIDRTDPLVV